MSQGKQGRPKVELSAEQIEMLAKMYALGLTIRQCASILGVGHATLERRIKEDPAVSEAIQKGRSQALLKVSQTAFNLAASGKVPAMTMFYLKCRANWSEVKGFNVTDIPAPAKKESPKGVDKRKAVN